MAAQRVANGKKRMVKIIRGIPDHADSFHDPTRRQICDRRERNNFVEIELFKAKRQNRERALSYVSSSPELRPEPPADLGTRREMRFEPRPRQTDKSDERSHVRNLDCPQAPAVLFNVSMDSVRQC